MIHQSSQKIPDHKLNTVKSFCFVFFYYYTHGNLSYIITVHSSFNGGSRNPATSTMECFESEVNVWKPLTVVTKTCILDLAGVIDLPLKLTFTCSNSALGTLDQCLRSVQSY